ncbi:hypothetical protein IW262DRAFT_52774 [Armillaria fumosa]|nr:hypothetical protein IW262DRAFT_52774 [Armillaria fumosa]
MSNPQQQSPQNDRQIRFFQLNVNKKKETTHTILNRHINDYDIFLVQEPNWGRIGADSQGDIQGPVGHPEWQPLLPCPSMRREDPPPRVMTYVKRDRKFKVNVRTDIIAHRDIQILDISCGEKRYVCINIYNDPDLPLKGLPGVETTERRHPLGGPSNHYRRLEHSPPTLVSWKSTNEPYSDKRDRPVAGGQGVQPS